MPKYPWTDHRRRIKETINSWKSILAEQDRKNSTGPQSAESPRLSDLKRCQQVLMFPSRPQPSDLISPVCPPVPNVQQPIVIAMSASALRALKQKRLKEKLRTATIKTKEQERINHEQAIVVDEDVSHVPTQSHGEEEPQPTVDSMENKDVPSSMSAVDLTDLMFAIASLRSKLDTVQPDGMRPSDIAKAKAKESRIIQDSDTTDSQPNGMRDNVMEESSDALLSQVLTSQHSIQLWDDLRVLVEFSTSISDQEQALVNKAVSELGLKNLEDGVLNRLCIDEIFMQDNTGQAEQGDRTAEDTGESENLVGSTKTSQLSYQSSLFLVRVLFFRKASELSSQPSRLFLDALLHAGRVHGRAIIDGVVLPLIQDYIKFSKPASELVQKVLKEQTSASLIHFLSRVFEPLNGQEGTTATSKDKSAVGTISLVFLSEAHLMTVQTALGLTALPCPLPTRLWSRLVAILGILWEQVTRLLVAYGSLPLESMPEDVAVILKMYAPTSLNESTGSDGQQVRLTNKVLIQLLLTWTMRQGPHCLEVENLQRLREFCVSRVDIKQGKALVSRLDMTIKKRSK
ncbi:MAG: hypothetical protein J3R72DRAFT_524008 [Linnemannia gamsii]|nr:MAG: hypothetical protein J3R72DRAFT_524008 [Linnemannia gamsii]